MKTPQSVVIMNQLSEFLTFALIQAIVRQINMSENTVIASFSHFDTKLTISLHAKLVEATVKYLDTLTIF